VTVIGTDPRGGQTSLTGRQSVFRRQDIRLNKRKPRRTIARTCAAKRQDGTSRASFEVVGRSRGVGSKMRHGAHQQDSALISPGT
jgi:hypothetical protein